MQTFLPYKDFDKSAQVLDMKRLGKQRVETFQVLRALTIPDYGWQSHPAVKMWRGHITTLYIYQHAICTEWTSRGYKDTCLQKSDDLVAEYYKSLPEGSPAAEIAPAWLGNEDLHRSHRSNLVRKQPDFYTPLFEADLPGNLEYVWPIQ